LKNIAFFFLAAFMFSCEASEPPAEPEIIEEVSVINPYGPSYALYINGKSRRAKYEPTEGAYLGAYVLNGDIKSFEAQTQKKHAIYATEVKLGEYPENFILDCAVNGKTPNIVITPPEKLPFNEITLKKTAQKFGTYDFPLFIQFYPNPKENGYPEQDYILFFRLAFKYFRDYAPNAAIVFTSCQGDIAELDSHYPGDAFVDWIGVDLLATVGENGKHSDVFNVLDYYYYSRQKTKPIMITKFGAAYYSKNNNKYYADEAILTLNSTISKIKNYYPRVKAFIYADFTEGDNDFSVTENNLTLQNYASAVDSRFFLEKIDDSDSGEINLLIKSPFDCYKINNKIFLSRNSVLYDTPTSLLSPKSDYILTIDDETFYNSDAISAKADIDGKIVILSFE
jgi:hypothetical protein